MPIGDGSQFQSRIQPLPDSQETAGQDKQKNTPSSNNETGNETGLVLKKFDKVQPQVIETKTIQAAPAPPEKIVKQKAVAKKVTPQPLEQAKPVVVEKKVVKAPEQKQAEKKSVDKSVVSGWVVQAGIFSKKENAESIAKILRSNGHQPKLSEAQTSFGKATRVWIGPFANKADAKALSQKIEQQTGNGGYVAAYPFKS